jgi:hypothetical protein
VCGYRYGIVRFYAIVNPLRVRCRGCGTVLTVERFLINSLLAVVSVVLLMLAAFGLLKLADRLGLHNPYAAVAFAVTLGVAFLAGEAWIMFALWHWSRLSVRETDKGKEIAPPDPAGFPDS